MMVAFSKASYPLSLPFVLKGIMKSAPNALNFVTLGAIYIRVLLMEYHFAAMQFLRSLLLLVTSHITRKRVGDFQPGKIQPSLLSYRS